MSIGKTIKQLRISEGLTQQSLSIMSGLSERFINYLERDKKKPSLRSLTKIADAVDKKMFLSYTPGEKVTAVKFVPRDTIRPVSFDDRIKLLYPRLLADCRKLCHYNNDQAKDIAQETVAQALLYHYRFNESSQLYTWLYRIARNVIANNKKKDKNLSFVEEYFETGEVLEEVKTCVPLYNYINRLSPKAKELYKLRLLNLPYTKIASQLKITPTGAKAWYWTINKQLRTNIETHATTNQ